MKKVRLSKSSISNVEKVAVNQVLDSEYLGMGEKVKIFEDKIKQYLNTDLEVVCVNTGTAALHLSIVALGLKSGDEILVPSLTYVASFQAISAAGAIPIACDINPETLFLDSNDARSKITNKTKAIMPVHYAGNSLGIDEIYSIADEYDLRVIEDAAQSFGSKIGGQKVGTKGDIVCFSFDGIKNITSGEGGAILTSDQNLLQKVRDMRLLGVEGDTQNRYKGCRSWDFDVKEQGFRYHMSNIMAAIGISQLTRIESFRLKRQDVANVYVKNFRNMIDVECLNFDFSEVLPHIFVIFASNRDQLKIFLEENNVETGVHYKPNHLLTKYKSDSTLPNVELAYKKILTLPCHYDFTNEEQSYVIGLIRTFYDK